MPRHELSQEFDLRTRGMSKAECTVSIKIDGRELPNMAVVGGALEEIIKLVQERVTDSFKVVPERVATPIAEPYKSPTQS